MIYHGSPNVHSFPVDSHITGHQKHGQRDSVDKHKIMRLSFLLLLKNMWHRSNSLHILASNLHPILYFYSAECKYTFTSVRSLHVSESQWFLPFFPLRTLYNISNHTHLNTLRPRQNGRHFADDIFKRIFFNENVWSSIKISLKFVPKGPINKIPASFQIMAWHCPGDKPLSEAMLVSLLTHKCVTRPQWVNGSPGIMYIYTMFVQ